MMAIRRDSLRLRLPPARSIEETGLDPSLYGGFLSPHGAPSPGNEPRSAPALSKFASEIPMAKDRQFPPPQTPACSKCQHYEKPNFENSSDITHLERKEGELFAKDKKKVRRKAMNGKGVDCESSVFKEVTFVNQEENVPQAGFSLKGRCELPLAEGNLVRRSIESLTVEEDIAHGYSPLPQESLVPESFGSLTVEEDIAYGPRVHPFEEWLHAKSEPISGKAAISSTKKQSQEIVSGSVDIQEVDQTLFINGKSFVLDSPLDNTPTPSFVLVSAVVPQNRYLESAESSHSLDAFPSGSCTSESFGEISESTPILQSKHVATTNVDTPTKEFSPSIASSKVDARSRWKRAAHSVKFINHLATSIRLASTDLIEDKVVDEMMQQQVTQDDAGRVGAAAFEGAKTVARSRSKGRKGMEGLLVRQDRGFVTFFQDFYVACLKMPIGHFLIGVFLAPLVLGLLFTPLYLIDVDGLSFNGIVPEDATTSPLVSARQRFLAFLNIFLYALSLSTTFGGAPIAAESPFCLLVANMNTLMAQFLFVFLSGAVFARMSQPSYPIRCSKKAIIKTDDLLPGLGLEQEEKFKVFAVRLVLTGPSPCELVDAKICLTFRIFVTVPSGSVVCSTQDLEVVRPEVSYLRYGLMVRHIIDKKSPVYGHTMDSLYKGDASFSLTVMGMERTSMQPVFHLEDYFVCDDDVIWDGDYEDFIRVDKRGQRILDHSQIDHLKPMKAAARVSQAVTRMKHLSHQKQEKEEKAKEPEATKELEQDSLPRLWGFNLHRRKLAKTMSTSFTRADW